MQHADKIDVFVAMKAGKMIPQADSRLFAADPRKGWIRVLMDSQDLLHFQWLHRDETDASFAAPSSDHAANSAAGELDVIVFPGEAVFEKVERPGARVFLLKFPSESDRNLLFWAQEAEPSTDAENIEAINVALRSVVDGMEVEHSPLASQGPPTVPGGASAPGSIRDTPAAGANIGGGEGLHSSGNVSRQDPAEPSVTPAGEHLPGTRGDGMSIGASQLAAALGNIMSEAGGGIAVAGGHEALAGPPLTEVLKAERLIPLLRTHELLDRLLPFIPETFRSVEGLSEIIDSPQFKGQLAVLSHALATGQLGNEQFGLSQAGYGVAEFLKAIQRQADDEKQAGGGSGEGKDGG